MFKIFYLIWVGVWSIAIVSVSISLLISEKITPENSKFQGKLMLFVFIFAIPLVYCIAELIKIWR